MTVSLSPQDFQDLVKLLAADGNWQTGADRRMLVKMALQGQPKADNLYYTIQFDNAPMTAAVEVIDKLAKFGRITADKEALGILLNQLLSYRGDADEQALFLRRLIQDYSMDQPLALAPSVTDWKGMETPALVKELIVGENTLREIRFVEQAQLAAQGVLRILAPDGNGSGFLVGLNLVMTNNHVLPDAATVAKSQFNYGYQLDLKNEVQEGVLVGPKPGGFFYTNPELDFSIVEVKSPSNSVVTRVLILKGAIPKIKERVSIIQHPGGSTKQISIQNNFVQYADKNVLHYTTSTLPGSSGSPVFNDNFNVVAVHRGATAVFDKASNTKYIRNVGSTMMAVLANVKVNAPVLYERLAVEGKL